MRSAGWLVLALALGGCATKGASTLAVKHVDGNVYELTGHVIGSLSGQAALQARDDEIATTFCTEKGRPMTVVDRHGYGGVAPQDVLTFRCGAAVAGGPRPSKPSRGA